MKPVLNSNMFMLECILWPDIFTASYFREHRNLVKALSKLRKEKKRCGGLKDHSREQSRVWLVLGSAIKILQRNRGGQSPTQVFMLP